MTQKELVTAANILDDNKLYSVADYLTRIAESAFTDVHNADYEPDYKGHRFDVITVDKRGNELGAFHAYDLQQAKRIESDIYGWNNKHIADVFVVARDPKDQGVGSLSLSEYNSKLDHMRNMAEFLDANGTKW